MDPKQSAQQKLQASLLGKVKEFPTLPTVYTKLSETIANPRCSAQDVADVISQDQASATKVLQVANSAVFGFVRQIKSINQAVVYIGFDEIKSIVLAISVIDLFKDAKKINSLDPTDIWKYSFFTGVIARNIAKQLGEKKIEEYFVAGIIHTIGRLMLLIYIPEIFEKILIAAKTKKLFVSKLERSVLGVSSSYLSEMLAEKWKLPNDLTKCLGNYPSGMSDGRFHKLTSVIHLSSVSTSMMGIGGNGDYKIPRLNKEIWEFLKLPKNFYSSNYLMMMKEYNDIARLLLEEV